MDKLTQRLKIFINYSVFSVIIISLFLYRQFGNYSELSELYGISIVYIYFRYETINLMFSIIFIILSLILLAYLVLQYKKYESSESKVLRFSVVLCMFIVSSSIIGGFHCLNYYGLKNDYKISPDIIEYQSKVDKEKFDAAKVESKKKVEVVKFIKSKITNLQSDTIKLNYTDYNGLR